ncbi:hypothetical protein PUV54_00045 [Hyphococcus flavus]|uniref:Uncharacterized protein n=1 Tax=Hyphococcus flavus TaxID=1866326 RepID=A0AAE9ZBE1_9PROT|nr:hypothetical protein [Hyphococcus flavus]WDI31584.1 hypothetical protein PUV54_00045 [Hyphococcus flavus]
MNLNDPSRNEILTYSPALARLYMLTEDGAPADGYITPENLIDVVSEDPTENNIASPGDSLRLIIANGAEWASTLISDFKTNVITPVVNSIIAAAGLDNITVTAATDLDAIRTRVAELDAAVILKGGWDASAGTFPGGGSAEEGHAYQVTTAGTVDGVDFSVNDRIIALTDDASTTTYAANWLKADYSDLVSSVVGLTGAISQGALLTALGLSSAAQDIADNDTAVASLAVDVATLEDTQPLPIYAVAASQAASVTMFDTAINTTAVDFGLKADHYQNNNKVDVTENHISIKGATRPRGTSNTTAGQETVIEMTADDLPIFDVQAGSFQCENIHFKVPADTEANTIIAQDSPSTDADVDMVLADCHFSGRSGDGLAYAHVLVKGRGLKAYGTHEGGGTVFEFTFADVTEADDDTTKGPIYGMRNYEIGPFRLHGANGLLGKNTGSNKENIRAVKLFNIHGDVGGRLWEGFLRGSVNGADFAWSLNAPLVLDGAEDLEINGYTVLGHPEQASRRPDHAILMRPGEYKNANIRGATVRYTDGSVIMADGDGTATITSEISDCHINVDAREYGVTSGASYLFEAEDMTKAHIKLSGSGSKHTNNTAVHPIKISNCTDVEIDITDLKLIGDFRGLIEDGGGNSNVRVIGGAFEFDADEVESNGDIISLVWPYYDSIVEITVYDRSTGLSNHLLKQLFLVETIGGTAQCAKLLDTAIGGNLENQAVTSGAPVMGDVTDDRVGLIADTSTNDFYIVQRLNSIDARIRIENMGTMTF